MPAPARRLRLLGLGVVLALTGCGDSAAPAAPSPTVATLPAPETRVPQDALTVVGDPDPAAASIAASEALFDSSPVVVVTDGARLAAAASAAIALGVPLLVEGDDHAPVATELSRLGAEYAVTDGAVALRGVRTVPLPRTAAQASAVLGLSLTACTGGTALADVLAVDPTRPCLLEERTDATPAPGDKGRTLPRIRRGRPRPSVVVLLADAPSAVPAAATARAAGARPVLLPADDPNPQRSSDAIGALSDPVTTAVLASGAPFAGDARLEWKVRTARGGWQLPGGGQLLFPAHLVVAIYGTPGAPVLGVLGEQGLDASIERARRHAQPYRALTDRTVVPAFEIIASLASGSPGSDGDYSTEIGLDTLRPWVEEAGRQGLYVVLDLQPGRTDFLTQARRYEELLSYPWVGLALDPEWRLGPNQHHLETIGSVGPDEVNSVVDYLAGLADAKSLPPKLLVLHQFRTDMVQRRELVDTGRPEVTVLVHVDGQGSQPAKQATWKRLHEGGHVDRWGWKNFYDEDAPMLTPEQTMTQAVPAPDFVTYQ